MSAVRLPSSLKTSTFSCKDCEKHFQYVRYLSDSATNVKIIFETDNTLAGHCSPIIEKIASRKQYKRQDATLHDDELICFTSANE